jgi:S-layer protein
LNNVGVATALLGTVAAGSGYETINLVSSGTSRNGGAAGVVTLDDGNGNSLTTVNCSGVQDLGLTLTPTTVTTIDCSAATGAVTVTAAAANGQNMTFKGGSGADILDVSGYTTNDTIDCGAGVDRLVLTAAQTAVTVAQSNVTNCENIGLSDGVAATTYTLSHFGATGLRFGANTAGAATVVFPAGTGTLDLQTFTGAGGALTVNHAGSGTADIVNITVGSTTAGNTFGAALTFGGAETINLLSQGGANSFAGFTMPASAGTQTLTVTGNQDISFITVAVTADVLNASGMTGSGALNSY